MQLKGWGSTEAMHGRGSDNGGGEGGNCIATENRDEAASSVELYTTVPVELHVYSKLISSYKVLFLQVTIGACTQC